MFWSYGTYVGSTVPMFALSCKSELKNVPDRAVLIMKKRFEDIPEGMYWGPQYNKDFNLSRSATGLYRYGYYIELRGDNYIFFGNPKIRVNKKTLSMEAQHLGATWLIMYPKCDKISTDRFYELVEE